MTRDEAFELGRHTDKILDNPFWKEWPREAITQEEEILGRAFVDGWCMKWMESSN